MSEVNFSHIAGSSINTPGTGQSSAYFDLVDKKLRRMNDARYVDAYINALNTVAQSPAAATLTYIAGSMFAISSNKLQVGSMFRWRLSITKTAAGIAASTYSVVVGTNGTTADTARVSFTKPAGTAIADEGVITIMCNVRSIGATGVMAGEFTLIHNGNTVGHAVVPCVVLSTISAGFDMTVANLKVGLVVTTGAADAITIQTLQAEAWDI